MAEDWVGVMRAVYANLGKVAGPAQPVRDLPKTVYGLRAFFQADLAEAPPWSNGLWKACTGGSRICSKDGEA